MSIGIGNMMINEKVVSTVGELIDYLSNYPDDMSIGTDIIEDYDGNIESMDSILLYRSYTDSNEPCIVIA